MTGSATRRQRSDARSNHTRILAVAREELSRNPDASLQEIAEAAGVVRRTIYGHFPNRPALIVELADDARQSLEETLATALSDDGEPPQVLARMILASWEVADRYRMLVALGRGGLDERTVDAILAPARAQATAIVERGQRDGAFADVLPAAVLARVTESVALGLLESEAAGDWKDANAQAAATSVLIAAGLTRTAARRHVRDAMETVGKRQGTARRNRSGERL